MEVDLFSWKLSPSSMEASMEVDKKVEVNVNGGPWTSSMAARGSRWKSVKVISSFSILRKFVEVYGSWWKQWRSVDSYGS